VRACSAAGLVLTLSRSPNEWHEGMQRSWLGAHAFMRELMSVRACSAAGLVASGRVLN
jgi:hypothetical protein